MPSWLPTCAALVCVQVRDVFLGCGCGVSQFLRRGVEGRLHASSRLCCLHAGQQFVELLAQIVERAAAFVHQRFELDEREEPGLGRVVTGNGDRSTVCIACSKIAPNSFLTFVAATVEMSMSCPWLFLLFLR